MSSLRQRAERAIHEVWADLIEAESLAQAVAMDAERVGDNVSLAKGLTALADVRLRQGRPDEGDQLAKRATELARQHELREVQCRALRLRGVAAHYRDSLVQRIQYVGDALSLMDDAADPTLRAAVLADVGKAFGDLGDLQEALRYLEAGLQLAEATSAPGAQALRFAIVCNQCRLLRRAGRAEESLERIEALDMRSLDEAHLYRAYVRSERALAEACLHRIGETGLRDALHANDQYGWAHLRSPLLVAIASAVAPDDPHAAVSIARRAVADARATGDREYEDEALDAMIRIAREAGDTNAALEATTARIDGLSSRARDDARAAAESLRLRLTLNNTMRERADAVRKSEQLSTVVERLSDVHDALQRTVEDAVHDLRGPLTAITLLTDGADTVRGHAGGLDNLRAAVEVVGDVIESLSDSRGDASPGAIFDASRVLEAILPSLEAIAAQRQVAILSMIDAQFYVRGSAASFRRIVLNLVDNAIKYGPEQGTVLVRLFADSDSVVLEVTDEGPGWPDAGRSTRGDRGSAVLAASAPGSGIGLDIVVRMAEQLGGGFERHTSATGGATARIWLPSPPHGRAEPLSETGSDH